MQLQMLLACLAFALMLACGQVLFKLGAMDINAKSGLPIWEMLASPWLFLAVALYGLSTVFWVWILTQVPISKAYPFTLIAAAMVPIAAQYVFHEPLSARYFVGFAVVMAGLAIIQTS